MLCALLFAAVHSASAPSAVAQATPSPQIAYRTYIRPRFDSFGYAGELRIAVATSSARIAPTPAAPSRAWRAEAKDRISG
jgi:hypothetical protein